MPRVEPTGGVCGSPPPLPWGTGPPGKVQGVSSPGRLCWGGGLRSPQGPLSPDVPSPNGMHGTRLEQVPNPCARKVSGAARQLATPHPPRSLSLDVSVRTSRTSGKSAIFTGVTRGDSAIPTTRTPRATSFGRFPAGFRGSSCGQQIPIYGIFSGGLHLVSVEIPLPVRLGRRSPCPWGARPAPPSAFADAALGGRRRPFRTFPLLDPGSP